MPISIYLIVCLSMGRKALCAVVLQEDGSDVSPWHDLPLYNDDGTLTFFCEITQDTTAKFEVATVCGLAL